MLLETSTLTRLAELVVDHLMPSQVVNQTFARVDLAKHAPSKSDRE